MVDEKAKKADSRARNWSLVVYPESAPENWRDILDDYHIPWVESPLHDKDINPDGEIKKAHWPREKTNVPKRCASKWGMTTHLG